MVIRPTNCKPSGFKGDGNDIRPSNSARSLYKRHTVQTTRETMFLVENHFRVSIQKIVITDCCTSTDYGKSGVRVGQSC